MKMQILMPRKLCVVVWLSPTHTLSEHTHPHTQSLDNFSNMHTLLYPHIPPYLPHSSPQLHTYTLSPPHTKHAVTPFCTPFPSNIHNTPYSTQLYTFTHTLSDTLHTYIHTLSQMPSPHTYTQLQFIPHHSTLTYSHMLSDNLSSHIHIHVSHSYHIPHT